MPVSESEAADMKRRHEMHVAELMGKTLSLLMIQTESVHGASLEQTAFVTKLSEAQAAARALAKRYDTVKGCGCPRGESCICEDPDFK